MSTDCTCGTPEEANFYIYLVIGRTVPGRTETDYVDSYRCTSHATTALPIVLRQAGWRVKEASKTKLR